MTEQPKKPLTPKQKLALYLAESFVVLAVLILAVSYWAQHHQDDQNDIFSPPFQNVPSFRSETLSHESIKGPAIVNFFASWCPPCEAEHPVLMDLRRYEGVKVYGFNFQDSVDAQNDFLERLGNPFHAVVFDPEADFARKWNVTAVPTTFVIDTHGQVVKMIEMPITEDVFEKEIKPFLP